MLFQIKVIQLDNLHNQFPLYQQVTRNDTLQGTKSSCGTSWIFKVHETKDQRISTTLKFQHKEDVTSQFQRIN